MHDQVDVCLVTLPFASSAREGRLSGLLAPSFGILGQPGYGARIACSASLA